MVEIGIDFVYGIEIGIDFVYGIEIGIDFVYGVEIGIDFVYGVEIGIDFVYGVEIGIDFVYRESIIDFGRSDRKPCQILPPSRLISLQPVSCGKLLAAFGAKAVSKREENWTEASPDGSHYPGFTFPRPAFIVSPGH
ncbi:hypothetical protein TNCT_591661 [Trichonephila clavata]|uniref:Uncharacterized protein n=1 Tax=Trichonephila clavata TaxID=2740835 RepID=A0A8X6KWK6_TRICU|nr:hypothetical protein TNCT_591661 [Trichonephila clavata]